MNFSLASNFASIAKSLSSTFASAATSVAAAKTPAAATSLPTAQPATTDVLRSSPKSDLAAQWHSDSLAERGIIIVSGKDAQKPRSLGAQISLAIGAHDLPKHNSLAERGIIIVGGAPVANDRALESIKSKFNNSMKDMESQDKLGNVEINMIMSNYNDNETLANSVLKKRDDTANSIINKI